MLDIIQVIFLKIFRFGKALWVMTSVVKDASKRLLGKKLINIGFGANDE